MCDCLNVRGCTSEQRKRNLDPLSLSETNLKKGGEEVMDVIYLIRGYRKRTRVWEGVRSKGVDESRCREEGEENEVDLY